MRPLEPEDAELIVSWRGREDVARQMFSDPPTLESHLEWFTAMRQRGDREEFVIHWLEGGDRPVGTVGLSQIDRRHARAEYGILLGDATARGKGLAREASELILRHAFVHLGLNRVFLHVFADNDAAIALYRELEFRAEGTLRRHARRRGDADPQDVLVMGVLAAEWKASKTGA